MSTDEIPIFKKIYELYRLLNSYRVDIPKADRYELWKRVESGCLELLELVLTASQEAKDSKLPALKTASVKLNTLRMLIRLAKDTKAVDTKKYLAIQVLVDEIGRMLGGWLRSVKSDPPPAFWRRRTSCLSWQTHLI